MRGRFTPWRRGRATQYRTVCAGAGDRFNQDDVPDLERVQDEVELLLMEADQIRDYKHFDADFKHQIYRRPVLYPSKCGFEI